MLVRRWRQCQKLRSRPVGAHPWRVAGDEQQIMQAQPRQLRAGQTSSPKRLRSRQHSGSTASIPISRSQHGGRLSRHTSLGTRAVGDVTPSTPASLSRRIASMSFGHRSPLAAGPRPTLRIRRVLSWPTTRTFLGRHTLTSSGFSSATVAGSLLIEATDTRGLTERIDSEISLICVGVVPQHPPTNLAPAGRTFAKIRHILGRAHVKIGVLHVRAAARVWLGADSFLSVANVFFRAH